MNAPATTVAGDVFVCAACGQLQAIPGSQLRDYQRGVGAVLAFAALPGLLAFLAFIA